MSLYESENLDEISSQIRALLMNEAAFSAILHRMGLWDMAYISLLAMEFKHQYYETRSAQDYVAMDSCLNLLSRYFHYFHPRH